MKTGKWGKSGTSNFTPPRDKDEEELWIISANKQREKTPDQLYREGKRLEAIYSRQAKANISAGVSRSNQKRSETPSLTKLDKLGNEDTPNTEQDIVNIYDEAIARKEIRRARYGLARTSPAVQNKSRFGRNCQNYK